MQIDSVYIGEIRLFSGKGVPEGWTYCNGQLLNIVSNPELYAVIGTIYGGDGRTNFALPDLRGRVPVHFTQNWSGGTDIYELGQKGGKFVYNLNAAQMPLHTHTAKTESISGSSTFKLKAVDSKGSTTDPTGANLAQVVVPQTKTTAETLLNSYSQDSSTVEMAENSMAINFPPVAVDVDTAGIGAEIDNMPPYLALNYIIALEGIMPEIKYPVQPQISIVSPKVCLTPAFNPTVHSYKYMTNLITAPFTMTVTANPSDSTVRINRVAIQQGAPYTVFDSTPQGITPVYIDVISTEGAASRYTVEIYNGVPYISDISLSAGKLSPNFIYYIQDYYANVDFSVVKVNVNPFGYSASAQVSINGTTVSGNAGQNVYLDIGKNKIVVIVSENDYNMDYTILINRNPILSGLEIDNGVLQPAFDQNIMNYSVEVDESVNPLNITATTADSNSKIIMGGKSATPVESGESVPVALNYGWNSISIGVSVSQTDPTSHSAESGYNLYQMSVLRKETILLKSLIIQNAATNQVLTPLEAFSPSTFIYDLEFPEKTNILISAQAEDSANSISIDGKYAVNTPVQVQLDYGQNTISVFLVSSDGSHCTEYTINAFVVQKPFLKQLELEYGVLEPTFQPNVTNYVVYIDYSTISSLTVTPYGSDTTQTITVNGTNVQSGTPSPSIPLVAKGNDYITIQAVSGKVTTPYIIKIQPGDAQPVPVLQNLKTFQENGNLTAAISCNVTGTVFCIMQNASAPFPSAQQIMSGLDGNNTKAIYSNSCSVSEGTQAAFAIGHGNGQTWVKIFFVAENTYKVLSDVYGSQNLMY